ncbi:MAG: DNA repair protein RadA [Clostridia bacterium]|nr:DNA repair protein RadA [Clostridia bacterium]
MKAKTVFVCKECGNESPKWMGRCPGCGTWNSMIEEVIEKTSEAKIRKKVSPVLIKEVSTEEGERCSGGSGELDRVLGGGIVKGSLVLCGGEPGIGKSTLLLQVAKFASENGKVLYVSGEESDKQIKLRAERLGAISDSLYVLNETDLESIISAIEVMKPSLVIADSIQTLYSANLTSAPGSVGQVRECTLKFMELAKSTGTTVFIVGHVTKEGSIAGPRVLEHMVDCVLYFEGERHQSYRIVRAVKNRFGSTNEIGVFEMTDKGLIDVPNPSLMLLSGRPVDAPGSAIVCSVEGTRPILAEIQALVSKSSFAMPRRMATGVDFNRVSLIMTVLEKRMGLHLGDHDAYVNVTGGIRLDESATDLAIACAIASSFRNKPLPSDMAFFGEVGLTGEIRTVTQAARRITEIKKMGFKRCMLPFDCLGSLDKTEGIQLISVRSLSDALEYIKE